MQSCATIGFGCPYCRTAMATAPEEDEDLEYESDEESEDADEPFSDDALRGFRFFFNNVHNEQHDHEDILEQQEEEEDEDVVYPKPPASHIAITLAAQGVNMEQLVKILLMDHDEYEAEELEHDRIADEVWGQMRQIITNYQPQAQAPAPEAPAPEAPAPELQAPAPAPAPQVQGTVEASEQSEPKNPNTIRRREFMIHV